MNMWIEATTLSASYKHFQAYKVTFTKPDGTKDVIMKDSYVADTTSWFEYAPDQAGEWTVKLDYLGQYFPAGRYLNGYIVTNSSGTSITQSVYYNPGSDGPYGLVVQEQQVLSWPPAPLPTDYWTRPVSPWNREWWPILGNFPGTGASMAAVMTILIGQLIQICTLSPDMAIFPMFKGQNLRTYFGRNSSTLAVWLEGLWERQLFGRVPQ